MEVEPTQYNMVYNALREAELRHSVYLDTLCVFRKNNPQLPDSRLFHTFVVNRDNKAVLIGNPIKNEKSTSPNKDLWIPNNQHLY